MDDAAPSQSGQENTREGRVEAFLEGKVRAMLEEAKGQLTGGCMRCQTEYDFFFSDFFF